MFAILTLYPQPTHLEYGKSLPQAQHHPSIHPLLNILPQPPHPHPHSQHPKHHSLTSMLHNPPPPTPQPSPTRPKQQLYSQTKKKKITRDERVASPSQLDRFFFFFFFFENTASCSFFSLCRSFKPIDIPLFHIDCSGF